MSLGIVSGLSLPGGVVEKRQYKEHDMVAYEALDSEGIWSWAVGSIAKIVGPRVVTIHRWEPKQRALSKGEEERAQKMLKDIQRKTAVAANQQTEAERLTEQLELEAETLTKKRLTCERNLAAADPALQAARKGLNSIHADHLRELRSYPTPPPLVRRVLEAILIILGETGPTTSNWEYIKTFVRKDDFIATIRDLDPLRISVDIAKTVTTRFLSDPEFCVNNANRASKAAGPLLAWIEGIIKYASVLHVVRPQQLELEKLSGELGAKTKRIDTLREEAVELQADIARLKKQYDELTKGVAEKRNGSTVITFTDWVPMKAPDDVPVPILHSSIICNLPPADVIDDELTLDKPAHLYLTARRGAPNIDPPNPLEKKVKSLQFEVTELEVSLNDRDQKLNQASKDLVATKELLGIERGKSVKLQQEIDRLRALLAERGAEIQRLKDLNSQTVTDMQAASKRKQEDLAGQWEGKLAALQHERESMLKKLAELEKRYADTKTALDAVPPPPRQTTLAVQTEFWQPEAPPPPPAPPRTPTPEVPHADIATQTSRPPTPEPRPETPPPPEPEPEDEPPEAEEDWQPTEQHADPNVEDDELLKSIVANAAPADEDDIVDLLECTTAMQSMMHPQYLKAYFQVTKTVASKLFPNGKKLKRIWVIDQLNAQFHNLDEKGTSISKSYSASHLVMLEKSTTDTTKLSLFFFGRDQNHELTFSSAYTRERFYELAQAMRPTVTFFCPAMIDAAGRDRSANDTVKITFNAGANGLPVNGRGPNGEAVSTVLKGDCTFHVSANFLEKVNIWVGSCNVEGSIPASGAVLEPWLPAKKFDLYAIAAHGIPAGSFAAWGKLLSSHLGQGYQTVATINFGGTALAVFCRARLLGKISEAQGSKYAAKDFGAAGISFLYYETPLCFVVVRLPPGSGEKPEAERQAMLDGLFGKLDFGTKSDFVGDHAHSFLFGDFNFPLSTTLAEENEVDLQESLANKDVPTLVEHDQFNLQRTNDGLLGAFQEPDLEFLPTAVVEGMPSYSTRVLYYTKGTIEPGSYSAFSDMPELSEAHPVSFTCSLGTRRTIPLCFMQSLPSAKRVVLSKVKVTWYDGSNVSSKLTLKVSCPNSLSPFVTAKPAPSASPGVWTETEIPPLPLVTPMHEVIRTLVLTLHFMEGSVFNGFADIPLVAKGEDSDDAETTRDFTEQIILQGALVGQVEGTIKCLAAPQDDAQLMAGLYLGKVV